MIERKSIPVTIITGFLGSGKTTLLNHILNNQEGIKTAVLVNEFGEIGIDNELIVETSEDTIELINGCICCSINGELLESVKTIIDSPKSIDYIIIETTGLADPLPIAFTFLGSELRESTRLDSIITIVDAENYNEELIDKDVSSSQIKYGDIILLNKCDLVDKLKLKRVEDHIHSIKKDSRIITTIKGNVSLPLILSVGLFESDKLNKSKIYFDSDHINCEHEHEHSHRKDKKSSELNHKNMDHSNDFDSYSFESNKPFSLRQYQKFLDEKLPSNIFRAKGILWFEESDKRHIFHLAGKRISIEDSSWKGDKFNRLIFIGKDINKKGINDDLNDCITNPRLTH
tara:strand:- start:13824 stop:14855 length:1032 start_codon:yes stop_codon:yes gene_type:complete